jgi:hypothetical protein
VGKKLSFLLISQNNNPKQCSNWIILVPFCSSHIAIQIATMFILWKFKRLMQKSIFPQKIQKSLCIQHFKRNYLENYNDSEHAVKTKNAPFFMNFLNINKNGNFFHWSFKFILFSSVTRKYYLDFYKIKKIASSGELNFTMNTNIPGKYTNTVSQNVPNSSNI